MRTNAKRAGNASRFVKTMCLAKLIYFSTNTRELEKVIRARVVPNALKRVHTVQLQEKKIKNIFVISAKAVI